MKASASSSKGSTRCSCPDRRPACCSRPWQGKGPICLDTCHVNDAGYPIAEDLDGVLDEFDRVIGLDRLKALHLNDSKNPLGSHKDRHEKLGQGTLGLAAFQAIVTNPRISGLPMILETPNELSGYRREIAALRALAQGAALDEAEALLETEDEEKEAPKKA